MGELAYVGSAVLVSVIGSVVVWRHQRQPQSLESNVQRFSKGLAALQATPEPRERRRATRR